MTEYKIHPTAEVNYRYDTTALKANIEKEGQLVPIILWNNQIVDGRHRYEVCQALDLEPTVTTLECLEEDIPRKVLSISLGARMAEKIQANCALVTYLETYGGKVTDFAKEFNIVNAQTVKYLRGIKEVRPTWFRLLARGQKVTMDNGFVTTTARKLYDACKEEQKLAEGIVTPLDFNPQKMSEDYINAEAKVNAILQDINVSPYQSLVLPILLEKLEEMME